MIKLNGERVDFKQFNDGTLRLKLSPRPSLGELVWLYDGDEEMAQLYFLVHHLRENFKIEEINLLCPYLPNARQDRIQTPDDCFTLRHFCHFINDLNFNKVDIFDPHSHVSEALLNNVKVISPRNLIQGVMDRLPQATLAASDEGGMKRYCKLFNAPYVFGCKIRNYETQKIESLQVLGDTHIIAGHDILICDDIISRGSTLYLMGKALKEMGARDIYVYVSHCENTVLRKHLNGQSLLDIPNLITKIYTTNSIYCASHEKIEVIHYF